MKTPVIRPYPTPAVETVRADAWDVFIDGVVQTGEFLTTYTPTCTISARRRLRIDMQDVISVCGINDARSLAVLVTWYSSGTAIRGRKIENIELTENAALHEASCELAGSEVADKLELRTRLVVRTAIAPLNGSPGFPEGAVLWDDVVRLNVSGAGAQFPVEIIDFAEAHLPERAAWYLDWSERQWERPLLGHVRLLVNRTATRVATASTSPEPTPEDKMILRMIQVDVARTLIESALADPEFINQQEWEEDSTGGIVSLLINGIFGDLQTASQIRSRSNSDLAAAIQSGTGANWRF